MEDVYIHLKYDDIPGIHMEETLSQCTMASKHPSIIQSHTRAEIILKGNLLLDGLNHKVDKTEVVQYGFSIFGHIGSSGQ